MTAVLRRRFAVNEGPQSTAAGGPRMAEGAVRWGRLVRRPLPDRWQTYLRTERPNAAKGPADCRSDCRSSSAAANHPPRRCAGAAQSGSGEPNCRIRREGLNDWTALKNSRIGPTDVERSSAVPKPSSSRGIASAAGISAICSHAGEHCGGSERPWHGSGQSRSGGGQMACRRSRNCLQPPEPPDAGMSAEWSAAAAVSSGREAGEESSAGMGAGATGRAFVAGLGSADCCVTAGAGVGAAPGATA
jgi:hypothetical protein